MWQQAKNIYHFFQGITANVLSGFPSRSLTVIGVTGTDGKTTTASMIYHLLQASGKKATLISTVAAIIDGKTYELGFHVTTPDAFLLQEFFKKAKKSNAEYVVLEVTSHAIDQFRTVGINFDIAVLTNVSHEHLDYHRTYEQYVQTKAKLLFQAKAAVVNRDDKSYEFISKIKDQKSKSLASRKLWRSGKIKTKKWVTYGLDTTSDMNPFVFTFRSDLPGEFNTYNFLAAIAVCRDLGLSDKEIKEALTTYKLPIGRMEIVYDKDFTVMIDFAHTPNAFINLLSSLEKLNKKRIIHVFGAAGKRDNTKRPEMGKASSQFADIIVLTAEDPRTEPIEKINNDILSGIKNSKFEIYRQKVESRTLKVESGKKYMFQISDRQEAISFAISLAQKDDVVVITGKSHEKSMNYGHGEEPWSEYKAVKKAIQVKFSI